MGAVAVEIPGLRPFDMRNGPPKRESFTRSPGLPHKHPSCLYGVLLGAVVCLTALPLPAQIPAQAILTQQATSKPAEQTAVPAPTPSPAPVQAVPLPQIADQAEELDRLLREVSKKLVPVLEVRVSDPEGKAHAEEVRQRARQTEDLLAGMPNMMQLQDEDGYWRALSERYGSQRKALAARAADIEEQVRLLDARHAQWQATSDQVRQAPGLEVVAERVKQEVDAIQKVRAEAQEQLNLILTLQNRISEQDREISGTLVKLGEAHERLRGRLFERDSQPLWVARELRVSDQSISRMLYMSAGRGFTGAPNFLRANRVRLWGAVAVYIFSLLAAFRFKRYVTGTDQPGVSAEASRVFARPWSVALLVTSLTTVGITAIAPTGVSFVVCLAYLIPILRLLPALIESPMRKVLYAISAFYALQWVHLFMQFRAIFKREFLAAIILIALVMFAWLTRPSRLTAPPGSGWPRKLFIAGIRVGLLLLAASLCANILGLVSLAQVLGVGTLFASFTFAIFYTLVRVLEMGLAIVLGSQWFRSLPEARADGVGRWGRRLLIGGASLLWLNIDLYFFTARDVVMNALKDVLEYPIGLGKVQVTLGGTLSLFFFLLLGYAVANIAKFILEEILLPRLSLRGGLAYAISRVTYYVLLVGIFYAAVTDAGVELNKFTMITGAVGLGVGFGLQNVVNNFASGLIILFERPFRVGDTVEVGGVVGVVRRIGARSCTLLTFQYAEVILPNSNLVSNQVTNWTLTSARRRVEVPVGVAYGTDPERALKLLIEVAESNSRILKEPKPEAFFLGFGDSALNLELRFWAAQSIWFELKSEIGLAVFRAFRNAGIEIPFPQRDLHLRSIDSAITVEGPGKDGISAVSNRETIQKVSAGR